MIDIKHSSLQIHKGRSISPFGVIISALAECESEPDMSLSDKAAHIGNALAFFIQDGYELSFCPDEDCMLIFKKSVKQG